MLINFVGTIVTFGILGARQKKKENQRAEQAKQYVQPDIYETRQYIRQAVADEYAEEVKTNVKEKKKVAKAGNDEDDDNDDNDVAPPPQIGSSESGDDGEEIKLNNAQDKPKSNSQVFLDTIKSNGGLVENVKRSEESIRMAKGNSKHNTAVRLNNNLIELKALVNSHLATSDYENSFLPTNLQSKTTKLEKTENQSQEIETNEKASSSEKNEENDDNIETEVIDLQEEIVTELPNIPDAPERYAKVVNTRVRNLRKQICSQWMYLQYTNNNNNKNLFQSAAPSTKKLSSSQELLQSKKAEECCPKISPSTKLLNELRAAKAATRLSPSDRILEESSKMNTGISPSQQIYNEIVHQSDRPKAGASQLLYVEKMKMQQEKDESTINELVYNYFLDEFCQVDKNDEVEYESD